MPQLARKHSDCENFASVDVVKGICRLANAAVRIDSPVCARYEAIAKCGGCLAFRQPAADGIGLCTGLKKEYWTAAHYNAGLCEGYRRRPGAD